VLGDVYTDVAEMLDWSALLHHTGSGVIDGEAFLPMTHMATDPLIRDRAGGIPFDPPTTADLIQARDGSMLQWGDKDPTGPGLTPSGAPVSIGICVSPVRPGHTVTVEYRVNGGPVCETAAPPELRIPTRSERIFRAVLPGQSYGLVEFLPVLRFAGQPISPRLTESPELSRFQVAPAAPPGRAASSPAPAVAPPSREPCWGWDVKFLASLKATLREQPVGRMPDGLRINWHVEQGSFAGPQLSGVVLPGAGDWMRIREDGVAIVNVRACLETANGARIYASYGGFLDLGPDGYARALRGQFTQFPPLVVTPIFETADDRFDWLNRAQCIGVGRVDTAARSYEFDVYTVQVGERSRAD
jgi:hypothetical protein